MCQSLDNAAKLQLVTRDDVVKSQQHIQQNLPTDPEPISAKQVTASLDILINKEIIPTWTALGISRNAFKHSHMLSSCTQHTITGVQVLRSAKSPGKKETLFYILLVW